MIKNTRTGKKLNIVEQKKQDAQQTVFYLAYLIWLLILLLFTPYTNNLDEIKVSLLFFFGPIFIVVYLFYVRTKAMEPIPKIFLYPILAYFIVMAISTLLSKYPWVGMFTMDYQWAVLGFFIIFFAAHQTIENLENGFYFIVLFILLTNVFGLFHYTGGFDATYKILWGDPDVVLPRGDTPLQNLVYTFLKSRDMFSTILNRDFYASLLVMFVPIPIAVVISTKEKLKFYVSLLTFILMLICIFLALSKDSFAGLLLTLFVFAVLYKVYSKYSKIKIPHLKTWFVGAMILFSTLCVLNSPTIIPKLKTFNVSLTSRDIIWSGGISIFKDYPVLGGGPGTFRIYFPSHRSPDHYLYDISNVTVYAHNRYIDLLCETGILGFAAYMTLLAMLFVKGFQQIRKCEDEKLKLFQISLFSGIIGILFTNFFSPNSRWTVIGCSYWAIMGLSAATYSVWNKNVNKLKEKTDKILNISILISFILTGFALLYKFYHLAFVLKTIDLSLFFIVICVFFAALFIIGMIQVIQKTRKNVLLDSVILFCIFMGIISCVFSIRYFKGAVANSNGMVLLEYKKYSEAIDQFNIAVEQNPIFTTSYYKMAHCYHSLGDVESAFETYQKMIQYQPDYAEIHYNLGVLYSEFAEKNLEEKDYDSAMEAYKNYIKSTEKAAKMSNKAIIQSSLGMAYITAFQAFNQMQREPELAKKYHRLAAEVFEKMLKNPNPPRFSEYYKETVETKKKGELILAQLYFTLDEYEKAKDMYIKLWQQTPDNLSYQVKIIECQRLSKEDNQNTINFMKNLLVYNPLNTDVRIMLARLYQSTDNAAEAKRQTEIILKIDPNNQSAQQLNKTLQ